jgi:hypothetical protein
MADEDFEDSNQGYDSGETMAPVQEAQEPVPSEYGGDLPPETADTASQDTERSWIRQLLDHVRSSFGINEEAIPTETGGEKAEATQQPADEGGIPDDTGGASFDRKTGTAGGVRSQPREATPYDQPAENTRATGNVERLSNTASGVAKNLFGAEQPEAGDTMRRIKEYVLGEGGMPNAERKAREAQFAANAGNQNATKSEIREGALKQAAQEGLDKGGAMLQNYRTNQQNYKGLAAGALDHGDRDGAAKLFNEGHSFVPDGAHAVASPSANGILMAVRNNATGDTKSTLLTDDQFRDMLHNRSGEFDHLTDQGLQKMIDQVAQTPGMPKPNQMGNAQPGGAGVANTPGATVPGQVGPTAAPAAPMQGAGVGNLPQGANVPQVGRQSALPSETPLPQPNPTRTAAPPAGPGGSRTAGPTPVQAATAIGGKQALQQAGKDPDGWPTGIPRGGQFANTKGSANRDFSEPVKLGGSGHVSSVGKAGSAAVYDVRGHTYAVGKDGLPIAKEGQPGYRGPGPGQPNWTGTQSDKINTRQAGDPVPQVIQRQPYSVQRAQDTNAIKREALDIKREQGKSSLDVKRDANEIKRDLGTKGNEIKSGNLDRQNRQGDARIGNTAEGNQIKREAIQQRNDHLDYLRDKSTGELNEKALSRLSRETNSDVGGVMRYIDSKIRSGVELTPKEQQYVNEIRERTQRTRQSP